MGSAGPGRPQAKKLESGSGRWPDQFQVPDHRALWQRDPMRCRLASADSEQNESDQDQAWREAGASLREQEEQGCRSEAANDRGVCLLAEDHAGRKTGAQREEGSPLE